jgi:ABC-type dipeptide/oligopeptide/nickel transport system permease component
MYVLKRLGYGVLTVWFIASATFFAMHALPGDPLSSDKAMSAQIRSNLHQYYGLDRPVYEQYFIYLKRLSAGDLGYSFVQKNRSVNDIIREHFPVSAWLGVWSMLFALSGSVFFGALATHYRNRWPDYGLMALVILAISVPSFVIAAFAQVLILKLNQLLGYSLLPVAGWGSAGHMLVPAMVLGMGTMAYMARLMRSSLLEVADSDYLRTARAKGLPPWRIFVFHHLRNAILPVITVLGPAIAAVTTGGFVVEQVFAIPGLGRYFVQAVQELDYSVIMGTTVFYGGFLVMMVILVDILYGVVDPRIRVER